MLKKMSVAVILLLLIVSFTVGSVNVVRDDRSKGDFPYRGERGIPVYTEVIVDITGENAMGISTWRPPLPLPPSPHFSMMAAYGGDMEFIRGRMTVIPAGANEGEIFPVMFFKHHKPGMPDRVSYMADTQVMVDNIAYTFTGEIALLNDTIITADIAAANVAGAYDNEIRAGQTNWHQVTVSGKPASLSFELKSSDETTDLRVVVYTPDGNILGPYTDDSDGSIDGRINMEIENPAGVADGDWSFKVTDTGATGKEEYYLKTW